MKTISQGTRWQENYHRVQRLWFRKWPLWSILLMFLVIGALLVLIEHDGFFHEVGVAFLIAALLGFSIDFYLHRSIAKDAFEGAMGYFLPSDVKEAVKYISGIDWFAEEFSLVVKLERLPDDFIKCSLKVRKFLKNVSNDTNEINSYIHIDDWGHSLRAQVISCTIKTASAEDKMIKERIDNSGYTRHGETKKLPVYPGNTVECLAEAVEIKRTNDDFHYVLAYCARSPKIYVEAPDELEVLVGLNAAAPLQKHPHTNLYEMPSFYLPWQEIVVRWFLKDAPLCSNTNTS
jgi:hypothetical protein